jgi:hypothetical protein
MNFYLDIANSLYTNTTEINGTHFYDRYEYIEIKHTESQFKGKVFYQNLINELVKHWRAKTPLSKGEHFSDDCISFIVVREKLKV